MFDSHHEGNLIHELKQNTYTHRNVYCARHKHQGDHATRDTSRTNTEENIVDTRYKQNKRLLKCQIQVNEIRRRLKVPDPDGVALIRLTNQ